MAAYEFEARHIAAIGLVNLTNISPGGGGGAGAVYTQLHDKQLASSLGKMSKRTAGFTWFPPFVRLGNDLYPMGACHVLSLALLQAKLISRRGAEWVAKYSGDTLQNSPLAARG